jgi:predicted RNase H-like HicB family nuclease
MKFTIELDREVDGRHIAEVPEMPGVMVYGETEEQAIRNVIILGLKVYADLIEWKETDTDFATIKNISFTVVNVAVPEQELIAVPSEV